VSDSPAHSYAYAGGELELFRHAENWKRYFAAQLAPFLVGDVIEVGAGMGGTSHALCGAGARSWTALEPDAEAAHKIEALLGTRPLAVPWRVTVGRIDDLPDAPSYDAAVYVDVLEHIADDRGELARCARRLRPGGALCVVSPAHAWLFSPFDAALGHHRRYSRTSLGRLTPPASSLVRLRYLDCAGLLASLGNRLLLRQSLPTERQILLWDRVLVRLSRGLDPLTGYRLGKSVLGVWRIAAEL
jgi:SAM-dependent methyltransferase